MNGRREPWSQCALSRIRLWLVACVACLAVIGIPARSARAEVKLPGLFGDHMVLQCQRTVPVWGKAAAGETVSVTLGPQTKTATADAAGRWKVVLDPLAAGGPHELGVRGRNTITLRDVLVGEVWLAGGQSNMEWPLKGTLDAEAAIAAASRPTMRLFVVPKASAGEPQDDCAGQWTVCSPETAAEFSGVAYYFGRELDDSLHVPVGLIQSAWSGAAVESLLPAEVLRAHPKFSAKLPAWEAYRKEYPALLADFEKKAAQWEREAKRAKAEGRPMPNNPARRPKDPDGPERSLGRLYNGMIHPLVPYALRGVIFYQGENNLPNPEEYRELFPMLIRDWRRRWGLGDFPFLFVQIANLGAAQPAPSDGPWCRIRDAQLPGLAEKQTAMVVTIDVGEAGNIHPKNKREVGRRLALCARALAYGQKDIEPMGPMFTGAE
ncbi:MAG: sialate O-acetylesterase, partial [Thermoguttaceae bacterium]